MYLFDRSGGKVGDTWVGEEVSIYTVQAGGKGTLAKLVIGHTKKKEKVLWIDLLRSEYLEVNGERERRGQGGNLPGVFSITWKEG